MGRAPRTLIAGRAYHGAVGGGDAEHAAATALAALTAMAVKERARNYTGGAYALLYADRLDEGLRLLDETVADVRRRGAVFQFSGLSMTRAAFQYARGALIEAEADARTALEALPRRDVWFWQSANALLAQILVERSTAEEAVKLLTRSNRVWRQMRSRGHRFCVPAPWSRRRGATFSLRLRALFTWDRR